MYINTTIRKECSEDGKKFREQLGSLRVRFSSPPTTRDQIAIPVDYVREIRAKFEIRRRGRSVRRRENEERERKAVKADPGLMDEEENMSDKSSQSSQQEKRGGVAGLFQNPFRRRPSVDGRLRILPPVITTTIRSKRARRWLRLTRPCRKTLPPKRRESSASSSRRIRNTSRTRGQRGPDGERTNRQGGFSEGNVEESRAESEAKRESEPDDERDIRDALVKGFDVDTMRRLPPPQELGIIKGFIVVDDTKSKKYPIYKYYVHDEQGKYDKLVMCCQEEQTLAKVKIGKRYIFSTCTNFKAEGEDYLGKMSGNFLGSRFTAYDQGEKKCDEVEEEYQRRVVTAIVYEPTIFTLGEANKR